MAQRQTVCGSEGNAVRPPATMSRRGFLFRAAAAGVALAIPRRGVAAASRRRTSSVIVLAIDGMDPRLTADCMADGLMPNARRLSERGVFIPLATTIPPLSPVAWSSFVSGANPGVHGVFDFVTRDPSKMEPQCAFARTPLPRALPFGTFALPLSSQKTLNLREGPTLWTELAREGVGCTVLRAPVNYPPTETLARTLSGLGTPDLQGGYGVFTFFAEDAPDARDVPGGRIERVAVANGRAVCRLRGPANPFSSRGTHQSLPLTVTVEPSGDRIRIDVSGLHLTLKEGEWSDWVPVRFPLVKRIAEAAGICRLRLVRAKPLSLYVSPINIDPMDPAAPISTPGAYAQQLAEETGRFHTQGMAEDTSALCAGVLDDDEYRQQAETVLSEQTRTFRHELGRLRGGFLFSYFSCLDLNSHVFWRAMDPGHPLHTDLLKKEHGGFLPGLYARMDSLIGEAMDKADERTLVLVVSDHGFAPFRRQFNLNSFLREAGYLSVREGAPSLFGGADWSATRAYGLGLNGLYLNLRGREAEGTVRLGADADRLLEDLSRRLLALRDPASGSTVVSEVYRSGRVFRGPNVSRAPDLIIGYNRPYRASWKTVLGSFAEPLLSDNTDPWSGDHALDASFMHGVLMANRPLHTRTPGLEGLAPTIVREFGLPPPPTMTGRQLEWA